MEQSLFEKPVVGRPVKKVPAFYRTKRLKALCRIHKSPPLDPTLCQMNPV